MKKLLHTNIKPLSKFNVQKVVKIAIEGPNLDACRKDILKKLRKLENSWGYSAGGGFDPSLYLFFTDTSDELYAKLMTTHRYVDQVIWPSSLLFTCYEFINDDVLETK